MDNQEIRTLIDALKEKTRKGQARWGKSNREREYRLSFRNGWVTTDNWSRDGYIYVDFLVWNDKGERIDGITREANEADYPYLFEIYEIAQRAYLGTDTVLRNLIDEVRSDKILGTDDSSG